MASDVVADSEQIERIFKEWDTDGDGFISGEELKGVLARLGMPRSTTAELMEVVDTNKDGRIDFNEFVNWLGGPADGAKTLKRRMDQMSVAGCAGGLSAARRPLPEVGASVLVQERFGLGFSATVQYATDRSNIGVLFHGISPERQVRVGCQQIHALGEALEEGWFPRWEFGHEKEGWRQYALDESDYIEAMYSSWSSNEPGVTDTVLLEGAGKMGDQTLVITFGPCQHFKDPWHHNGTQLNKKSGHLRPVRRTLRDAASVNADSKEGWVLCFGSLPVNVVCDIWNEVQDGNLEEAKALSTLQSLVYRKRVADLPQGDARHLARLRYGGPHIDAFAGERDNIPVCHWEWFHGGDHREWKSYRGVECDLLERRYQAQSKHALMNGGKPSDGWSLKPLRVLLNVGWTSQGGKHFAAHTQIDLVSRRRRGVRRQEASKGTWDYIFFCWLRKFQLVPAAQVYVEYDKYLRLLLEKGPAESHVEMRAQAEASLSALQNGCVHFVEPPQDEVPEAFLCPIGSTLMLTPAFQLQNPDTARMERDVLVKWVREKGTHPLTGERMETVDIVADEELIAQIAEWLRSFTESK